MGGRETSARVGGQPLGWNPTMVRRALLRMRRLRAGGENEVKEHEVAKGWQGSPACQKEAGDGLAQDAPSSERANCLSAEGSSV